MKRWLLRFTLYMKGSNPQTNSPTKGSLSSGSSQWEKTARRKRHKISTDASERRLETHSKPVLALIPIRIQGKHVAGRILAGVLTPTALQRDGAAGSCAASGQHIPMMWDASRLLPSCGRGLLKMPRAYAVQRRRAYAIVSKHCQASNWPRAATGLLVGDQDLR